MSVYIPNLPDIWNCGPLTHGFFEDFDHYVAADRWNLVADTGGTVAVIDGAGGQHSNATDGDDNDESYLITTHELFLIAANKPLVFIWRGKFTEANTDDANIFVGLAQEAAADLLADDGAGVATTLDGVGFYKVDGGTRWQVISSNATTQTTTDTEYTAGGGSFETLAILVTPINADDAEVTFWIDRNGGIDLQQCRENGANPRTPAIKHTLAMSGMAEMHVAFGAKAGGANAETLITDYVGCYQKR